KKKDIEESIIDILMLISSELLMDLNLFYIHLVIFLQYIFIEFYNKNISYYYIKQREIYRY
ncbi:hypothetical protein PFFVO_06157, partial [Plasmodium falciparum Vietnam Oak-Knoll (FVO)]